MNTLDEYIKQFQEDFRRFRDSEENRLWQLQIEQECKKNGFWVVGGEKAKKFPHPIWIGYHGLPDDFSKNDYMHRHNNFELMYIYRGECVNKTPENTVYLHTGDIMLLNPNVLHCPHVEHEDDILLNIAISNDLILENIVPILRDNPLFMTFFVDFLYRSTKVKQFLYFNQTSAEVRNLCENMCLEYFQQKEKFSNVLEISLSLLFTLLARDYKSNYPFPKSSDKDGLIDNILAYIGQNCSNVTRESLSEHFQYSPSYLSRIIRQSTGKSFSEILHAQRMTSVTQYLASTDLSVTEVANIVGFYNIPHFNRTFKDEYGCTPTEYRKSIQKRH